MKKATAIVIALIMTLTLMTPAFAASSDVAGTDVTDEVILEESPDEIKEAAIIVPGVIETMLMTDPSAGRDGRFYAPVTQLFPGIIKDLVLGVLKALFLFNCDKLIETALELEDAAIGNLDMAPDGTSVHDIKVPISGVAECSYEAALRSGGWDHVDYGAQIAPDLAEEIGAENVFIFAYDWRLGSPTLREKFAAFLADVKTATGCDKVHIYSDSYGCQIVASYLYEYGGADDIDRIVFDSPAWTGTALFGKVMDRDRSEFRFNMEDGARILLNFAALEPDFARLTKLLPDRIVQNVAYAMVGSVMEDHLLTAPGLWCCCSVDDYEELKAEYLDPELNAAVIAEVDEAQYGVMSHIPEVLARAEEDGISLSVIMNEGTQMMLGKNINSDGVVDAASGSGGECLPIGETFKDGRTGARVSPANDYDLTNAFLPDRTWVFHGQTHGQSYWDDVSRELVAKLMLTDDIESVDSDPRFPQFSDSHCPTFDVSLRLESRGGSELRLSEGKVTAVIRNDSETNKVTLTGVCVKGIPYRVSGACGVLQPGETKTVTLTPGGKASGPSYGTVNISYIESDYLLFAKTRTQYFKVTD